MPPLASVEIPIIDRTNANGIKPPFKAKAPARQVYRPRTYSDEPLPIGPSSHAPKNARIVGRVIGNGVSYQLAVGDVEINDVGADEILDYVSALDLEEYEHRQFEEEREVRKVIAAEVGQLRQEKAERAKERAKRKGVVLYEDADSTNDRSDEEQQAVGKHGRARPTYKHLFKMNTERRRSSEGTEEEDGQTSDGGQVERPSGITVSAPLAELPKRRRRKRDKATGKLLPLSPVAQRPTGYETFVQATQRQSEDDAAAKKRRHRRRRHPQTGELMPIGWLYDPNDPGEAYENRHEGLAPSSFRKLSLSQEHSAKRQRLDTESSMSQSSSPIPTKAELAAQLSPVIQRGAKPAVQPTPTKALVLELSSSDEEMVPAPSSGTANKLKPQPKARSSTASNHRMLRIAAASSAPETSPEPETRTSILRPSAGKRFASDSSIELVEKRTPRRTQTVQTSIVNPSATRVSSTDLPARPSEEDDSLEEDEWFIESILSHHLSDPKTHPSGSKQKPVMLYQVKWEGFPELTWEPLDSFGDRNMVRQYRWKVGLASDSCDEAEGTNEDATMMVGSSTDPQARSASLQHATTVGGDDDDDSVEDEFEVESIVAHHLSDPRTHPVALGKTPVMLYKTKWQGSRKTTWEPASGFGRGSNILRNYSRRAGLSKAGVDSDGDHNMIILD